MAGTTTKSHDNQGLPGGTMRDLLIQHNAITTDVENVRQSFQSVALNSGGLAIFGAASPNVKTVSTITAVIMPAGGGATNISQFAAGTLAALAGTVPNGNWGVWFFTWDGATQSAAFATAAVFGSIVLPQFAPSVADIGCVIIHPTGAGNFVGGTTALDDAGVVPNAVYINFTGTPILSALRVNTGLTAAQVGNMVGTAITV